MLLNLAEHAEHGVAHSRANGGEKRQQSCRTPNSSGLGCGRRWSTRRHNGILSEQIYCRLI